MRVRHPTGRGGRLWLVRSARPRPPRRPICSCRRNVCCCARSDDSSVLHRRTLAEWERRLPRRADLDRTRRGVARHARRRPARVARVRPRPTSCGATRWARTTRPRRRASFPTDAPGRRLHRHGRHERRPARAPTRARVRGAARRYAPSGHRGRTRARRDPAAPAHARATLDARARGRAARPRLRAGGT